MKIKCFSKRKLNVRISKTKIKCAILGFSQNCSINFWENPEKNWSNLQKFSKFWQIVQHFVKISKKKSAIFNEKIEIRERFQNGAKECIV